jgi:ribosome assembly protein RRB1
LQVWDLRSIRNKTEPLANFNYHTKAISSIEWSPHDESILCLSSADNQVTIWDLSVEADEEDISNRKSLDPNLNDFPPQLLFIHQGQNNVKEIHHHNQIPGVIMTTAEDGLNIFKAAINVT